jgi:GTP-binding protein
MFIDETKIYIKAGNGGEGIVSFRREKFIPKGGPDGGDGGKGGDIIICSKRNINTLYHIKFKRHFKAENGKRGGSNNKTGAKGNNVVINVPLGTTVSDKNGVLYDFLKEECVTFARGGRGGRGNATFKSPTNRTPRTSEKGEKGEEKELFLDLKLIANVGLVGLPNAGKSTFLRAISRAKPNIAPYPFTTLTPFLGYVAYRQDDFIVADIPGIIEGASKGKGLGLNFLRHIERTTLLLLIIDASSGFKQIVKTYNILIAEMKIYSEDMLNKKSCVVLNKMDLIEERDLENKVKKEIKCDVFPISALKKQGIEKVLEWIYSQRK